ncbi:LacI family DNA-binding transcriptional regulator [Paenibacillus paridis]|uniref:LacI family DNA-binding transcriptional regulator n=1 Tax=Paenibacillus paridis TaxID=2583376 RepID=UPI001120F3CE|nr:LacI family DNA-binding transcriptional regulator [Paenibacillus paridis]
MTNISIKDIAAKAQVSTATVSYVLNGTRNVKQNTRERVLQVIEEMNYKPNNAAQSLKRRRTNTIGVIAEDVTVFNVPEIIDGIHDCAERLDMHILLTNMRLDKRIRHSLDDMDTYRQYAESAVSELLSKQVEGIIYIGVHPRDLTGLCDTSGKPIVYTYSYTQSNPSIQYDDEQAAYDAMKHLIDKGHSRIAIISGIMNSIPSRLRFNGFYKAVTEFELPFDPLLIKMGDWEAESGYQLTKELLGLSVPPTAILAMNDVMAVGVMRAAFEMGFAIPEQLSVMGFDNREFTQYLIPRITTMDLPLHEIGYQAMEAISRILQGEDAQISEKPLCRLVERDSVAPPKR